MALISSVIPLIVLLVLTMTLSSCSQVQDVVQDAVELWLEDYTRNRVPSDGIQSDSPQGLADDPEPPHQCPIAPTHDPSSVACLLPKCDSDDDCPWPKEKCCHNGCLDTCVQAVPPPPYFDWRREPQRNPIDGISWLIKDEDGDKIKELLHKADHCAVDSKVVRDGEEFQHHHHKCKCHKGRVKCHIER